MFANFVENVGTMEKIQRAHVNKVAETLPPPPKVKETLTPTQVINSGLYTDETLIDLIEQLIIKGKSFRSIAKLLKIEHSSLSRWLSKEQHSARVKMAARMSADYYADMSIQVLKDAPSDKLELLRAKELASAYRWMARVRDVSKYGEKLDVTSDGQQLVQISLGAGVKPPELTEDVDHIDITNDENPKQLE